MFYENREQNYIHGPGLGVGVVPEKKKSFLLGTNLHLAHASELSIMHTLKNSK